MQTEGDNSFSKNLKSDKHEENKQIQTKENLFSNYDSLTQCTGFEQAIRGNQNSIDNEIQSNPSEAVQSMSTNKMTSMYDTAFKKPHFLKPSVFEDDIAAFKDESSPFILSTRASSLSSLTIDDDDYDDNSSVNKAGLIKKKPNENWRQDPIGGISEPLRTSRVIETKRTSKTQYNAVPIRCPERQITQEKLNKNIFTSSQEELRKEQSKKINWNGQNIDMTKYSTNPFSDNYYMNAQNTRFEAEGSANQCFKTNKSRNNCQSNQKCVSHNKSEIDFFNKNSSKYNSFERYREDQRNFEQNRCVPNSYRVNSNRINYDENSELNAYEEQLLDQCIRKGMAKVTKRSINEIKPFCWDLNQICLTTRAMLKISDEDIVKDRRRDCSQRHILQNELLRHPKDYRT